MAAEMFARKRAKRRNLEPDSEFKDNPNANKHQHLFRSTANEHEERVWCQKAQSSATQLNDHLSQSSKCP
jgi:hypothetical protein